MEKDITSIIKKKFVEFRNYRHVRLNEAWEIQQDEWIAYFADPQRSEILTRYRGVSLLRRHNAVLPWSIDNLEIGDKALRTYTTRRRLPKAPMAVELLEDAFRAKLQVEAPLQHRFLTKTEWIAELKENHSD